MHSLEGDRYPGQGVEELWALLAKFVRDLVNVRERVVSTHNIRVKPGHVITSCVRCLYPQDNTKVN